MAQLQCQKCNYKFETAKKPSEIRACPYCGTVGSVKEIPSASALLRSVETDEASKFRKSA